MSSTKTTVRFVTYLVVVFTLSAQAIESAKAKVEFGPKAQIPDDKLFQDQVAFCEGCYGFVQEIHKLLMKWSKEKGSVEDHIDAAMVAVCSTERLRSYVLSPPKMERLCAGIRAHYEDDIGLSLLTHYGKKKPDVEKVFSEVCKKTIPACPKNMKPMSVGRKEQREKEAEEKVAKEKEEKKEKKNTTTNEEEKEKREGKASEERKQKTGKKGKKRQKKDEL